MVNLAFFIIAIISIASGIVNANLKEKYCRMYISQKELAERHKNRDEKHIDAYMQKCVENKNLERKLLNIEKIAKSEEIKTATDLKKEILQITTPHNISK